MGRYISLERITETTKDSYYDALKQSSEHWHTAEHNIVSFWNYFLGVVKEAYAELAERVSLREGYSEGKSELSRQEALSQVGQFSLSDLTRELKSASLQLVKKVLAQLKDEGRLELTGRGRGARWRVKTGNQPG